MISRNIFCTFMTSGKYTHSHVHSVVGSLLPLQQHHVALDGRHCVGLLWMIVLHRAGVCAFNRQRRLVCATLDTLSSAYRCSGLYEAEAKCPQHSANGRFKDAWICGQCLIKFAIDKEFWNSCYLYHVDAIICSNSSRTGIPFNKCQTSCT